jgi:anaerobic ribonucleoside-triphosphate reductase
MTGETDETLNPETVPEKTRKRIPCEVYSRVAGYYRPVSNWNPGKQQEFEERLPFIVPRECHDKK